MSFSLRLFSKINPMWTIIHNIYTVWHVNVLQLSILHWVWNRKSSEVKESCCWTEHTNIRQIIIIFQLCLTVVHHDLISSTGPWQDPWTPPLTENSIQLGPAAPALTFPGLHGTFTVRARVSITRLSYHTCVLRPQPGPADPPGEVGYSSSI